MPVIQSSTITREESVADIVSSIAAEESAIAHILNAESEKLQVIINMPDVSASMLMTANRSVKNVVDIVIRLENALKNKLELFSDMFCQTKLNKNYKKTEKEPMLCLLSMQIPPPAPVRAVLGGLILKILQSTRGKQFRV